MAKATQNRVKNDDGSTMALSADPQSFVSFLTKFDALRFVQATETVKDADGNDTVKPIFNEDGSPKMAVRPRSGYDKYYNNDGFSNPMSPEALSPQGVGKLLAKLFQVAHATIAAGGTDGDEMKTVLAGALAYEQIAAQNVVAAAETDQMEEALAVLTKGGKNAEEAQQQLAAFLASKGIVATAPTTKVAPPPEPADVVLEADPSPVVASEAEVAEIAVVQSEETTETGTEVEVSVTENTEPQPA